VFVSIRGSPYARFRKALELGSATLVTAAASELPSITLADALAVCLVYARTDRERFSRAIVRWHARMCLEARGMTARTAQLSLAAAHALPEPECEPAAQLLAEICSQHGLDGVADVLDRWLARGRG
jgi:hypothetical protein